MKQTESKRLLSRQNCPTDQNFHHRSRAFTLLELLVVLAIITVLVAILYPTISNAIVRAEDVGCRSNLATLHKAMLLHATNYDGILPGNVHAYGSANGQRCWMGKEVLEPTDRVARWSGGWNAAVRHDGFGELYEILRLKGRSAQKLYRCPALDEGAANSGVGSNGRFDYSSPMIWAGADVAKIPSECIAFRGDRSREQKFPAPLILEEDTYWWLNRVHREPGFGNLDHLGMHHVSHGNFVAIDGAVHHVRFDGLGPNCNQLWSPGPTTGRWINYNPRGFGGWNFF